MPDANTKCQQSSSYLADQALLPDAANKSGQSRFVKACWRQSTDRTPVWLMRQAGRYQKFFRDLRARIGFLDLCKDSAQAAEVTVRAAAELKVDAAIIFADILLLLEPLGVGLRYEKGAGPVFERPIATADDISKLCPVDVAQSLDYVFTALRLTRAALPADLPLIGFAGAPFTLASYLIEGGSARHFEKTKSFMYGAPDLWHSLMDRLSNLTIEYLNLQIDAGVDALQLFDSWVGCLSPADYQRFVYPYSKRIFDGVKKYNKQTPLIHFGTGTAAMLGQMRDAGGDVIGIDWRIEIGQAWQTVGFDRAVQGNLDPSVLLADRAEIKRQTETILKQVGQRPGYIFNLGHGILPSTPEDNVKYLVSLVQEHGHEEGGRR